MLSAHGRARSTAGAAQPPTPAALGLYVLACDTVGGKLTLLTVVSCKVFRLQTIDGEGKICPIPTATEPHRDPRDGLGSILYKALWSLVWFLLVPGQEAANAPAGPAADGDSLPWSPRQGGWWLGQHSLTTGG